MVGEKLIDIRHVRQHVKRNHYRSKDGEGRGGGWVWKTARAIQRFKQATETFSNLNPPQEGRLQLEPWEGVRAENVMQVDLPHRG